MKPMNKAAKTVIRTCAAALSLIWIWQSPALADVIQNVAILQHDKIAEGQYSDRIALSLGTQTEHLLLTPSQVFSELVVTDSAGNILNNRTELAQRDQYEGIVENVPGSWVRLTVADDSVSGIIDTGKNRLYIDASEVVTRPQALLREAMQLTRTIDHSVYPPAEKLSRADRQIQEAVEVEVTTGFLNKPGVISRVIRAAIVIDNLYDEAVGGRGFSQAISTINSVDGLYREHFGLALKVDRAIVLTDDETLPLGSVSLDENLSMFRDYRMSAPELSNDLGIVHLFTGATTTDNASVGLAYIGSACRTDGYDVSMSLPFRYPALLAAHEIGHNLGAEHDNETEICGFDENLLMHSDISSNTNEEFSSCSRQAINTRLEQNTCFFNAIDLDLQMEIAGNDDLHAVITNTDLQRAFPSATLTIELKNATVASAPALCEIEGTTLLRCSVATTLPEQSQALDFSLRLDSEKEITIQATVEAEGFFDVQTYNNSAEIVLEAKDPETDPILVIATSDDPATGGADTPTATAPNTDATPSGGNSGGGGSLALLELLTLLAALAIHRFRPHNRRQRLLPIKMTYRSER